MSLTSANNMVFNLGVNEPWTLPYMVHKEWPTVLISFSRSFSKSAACSHSQCRWILLLNDFDKIHNIAYACVNLWLFKPNDMLTYSVFKFFFFFDAKRLKSNINVTILIVQSSREQFRLITFWQGIPFFCNKPTTNN